MHGGSTHTCGLRPNGAVLCWGGNDHRQASPPPNIRLTSLSTSYNHNCGLQENGIAVCWGAAGLGNQTHTVTTTHPALTDAGERTGDLRRENQTLTFAVPGTLTGSATFTIRVTPFYNNSALRTQPSHSHTLSVPDLDTSNPSSQQWPVNSSPHGPHNFNVQYEVNSGVRVISITLTSPPPSLNRMHWTFSVTYPVTETRTDNLTETILDAPRAIFTAVSAGYDHTCAIDADGSPECWGDNSEGQSFPPSGLTLKAISAGFRFSCGLRTDGTPVCWGDTNRWTMPTPTDEVLVSLTTGGVHACGLRDDGTPVCWGRNNYRQSTPPEGEAFSTMSAGERYTCALRLDGTPMCWGNNSNGQTAAPRDEVLSNIHSGLAHTCGIRPDSTPVCWGDNSHDQNWPPFSAPRPTPTPRPYELYGNKDPDCYPNTTDPSMGGCKRANISLDRGFWQLSVRLRENYTCTDTPQPGPGVRCAAPSTNEAAPFSVTLGEGDEEWVALDYTGPPANTPVANLSTGQVAVTFRVGPDVKLEDGTDGPDDVEPGRQVVTVRATGIWTLTFTFVRDLPPPSS